MPSTIDQAFIEEYNADVHMNFRQSGSRLMNMTRKGTVRAKSVYFQKFGLLTAQQKTRNAQHNFIDPEHTNVKADMADWYVPTLVDDLDLLKLNIEERRAHSVAQVSALGKKADQILIAAMEGGAHASDLGDATKAFDFNMAMNIVTTFQMNEVPDDGQRYCALHPYAWAQFLKVPEFANADYVGHEALPFKGMTGKYWMGVLWFPLVNVTHGDAATDVATNLAWHRSVVGHGVNKEVDTKWDWENTYSAWSCVSAMSMGATIIEDNGMFTCESLSPQPAA